MQVDLSAGGDETWLAWRPTLQEEVSVSGLDEDREERRGSQDQLVPKF